MPSTYSTSLRLTLQATGENRGTWGTITNTNLGTLLEQAIAGVQAVAVSGSGDYSLTTSNGASDEARSAVLSVTGALSGTKNIIIPSVQKVYTVKNGTTGSQNIVVKTTGGVGVTIPPGYVVSVFCDGTDTYQASSLTDTTSGSSTPTGAVIEFAGSTAPYGFLMCDGSAVSRTTYAGLFAVIGTTWGAGNGSTTFNVPDKRGKVGIGADGATYILGASGGAANVTLSTTNLPSHDHTFSATSGSNGDHSHTGTTSTDGAHTHTIGWTQYQDGGGTGRQYYTPFSAGGGYDSTNVNSSGSHSHTLTTNTTGAHTHTVSGTTSQVGSGTAISVVQPYAAASFIIKT